MIYEQKYTKDWKFMKIPIDVECTHMASTWEALKDVLEFTISSDSLEPFNFVSFRLLVRIANFLQGIEEKHPQINFL